MLEFVGRVVRAPVVDELLAGKHCPETPHEPEEHYGADDQQWAIGCVGEVDEEPTGNSSRREEDEEQPEPSEQDWPETSKLHVDLVPSGPRWREYVRRLSVRGSESYAAWS